MDETSFLCNYRGAYVDLTTVLLIHKLIDKECGSKAKYGHVHFWPPTESDPKKYFHYSVGRTFRGDEFCKAGFHPASLDQRDVPLIHADVPRDDIAASQEQEEDSRDQFNTQDTDSLKQQDVWHHDGPTSAQIAIPDHLRDQGNGHYSASYDETGKISVIFTPMDELFVKNITDANTKRKLPEKGMYGYKYGCSGESDSWLDLGRASDALAAKVNGVNYKKHSWQWVHK